MLAFQTYGEPGRNAPLLISHGLFGSARNWGVIARRLSTGRRVVAVDMRNHGASDWHASHTYHDLATDLAEVIEAQGAPFDVLGHSMGGKAAMILALSRPELLRRLIVADIAPVAYSHSQSHLIAAMRRLDLHGLTSRAEADRRLAVDVEDAATRAFLLQSLDLKSEPPRWRLNLDVLEADMRKITGWPDLPGAPRFDGPALFLSGALSNYLRAQDRDTIKALFPAARFAKILDAGHWLHAEKPREFESCAAAFLDS